MNGLMSLMQRSSQHLVLSRVAMDGWQTLNRAGDHPVDTYRPDVFSDFQPGTSAKRPSSTRPAMAPAQHQVPEKLTAWLLFIHELLRMHQERMGTMFEAFVRVLTCVKASVKEWEVMAHEYEALMPEMKETMEKTEETNA